MTRARRGGAPARAAAPAAAGEVAGVADIDARHMARCLELAAAHRGRTAPNPIVGCVIVGARGEVLAEGAHRAAGTPHAEVVALAQLGGRAPGATLYVSLEPCHHHGRTPPCTAAVRAAGVARVVAGAPDPVPGHGGGAAALRRAGIAVTLGVLRERCERANLPFFVWARHGRPAFTLKAGITLDGKVRTVAGASRWITGAEARADVARLRDERDAVLVGIGTVLADDPRLTVRGVPGGRDPLRVVLDSRLRTPTAARLLPGRRGPRTILACAADAPASRERALVAGGAEVWRLPAVAPGRLDLAALAARLAAADVRAVLVEGGPAVHASMLAAGLADELVLYLAPRVVGGPALSWVGGAGIAALADAPGFAIEDVARVGADVRLTAVPERRRRPQRRR
jgi:diaminohydroxyphosphoribosylaminopyrimidine deaminase/5-amino-6-(5-phosphoribosylamino)uracil reductase